MLMKKFLLSLVAATSTLFAAQAAEEVIFEGSTALSWGATNISPMTLSATSDVKMKVTIEVTVADWWQFKFVKSDWSGSINLLGNEFVNANTYDGTYSWDTPQEYTFEYDLTEDQIAEAKKGLIAQGSINKGELLLKKVVVIDSSEEPAPGSEKKELVLTLKEAKANPWDSQVVINFPKVLEAGKKYTITMDVKGSVALEPKQGQYGPEAIQPIAQDANSANKDQYGGPADLQYLNHFAVTTDWVKGVKDCDGNAIVTDGNFPYSRLMLNVGYYAGELSIDNVRAIDEAGEEYFCITFDTKEEQKLVEDCWMKVPKTFATGLISIASESSDEVAYDLFGNPGASKGFMVKGGKKVYVK